MIQTLTGTKAVYGSEVESKIIEFTIVGADEVIAEKLGISVGDFVYKIIRYPHHSQYSNDYGAYMDADLGHSRY